MEEFQMVLRNKRSATEVMHESFPVSITFRTEVKGSSNYSDEVEISMRSMDFVLEMEPENEQDKKAIRVLRGGVRIGYLRWFIAHALNQFWVAETIDIRDVKLVPIDEEDGQIFLDVAIWAETQTVIDEMLAAMLPPAIAPVPDSSRQLAIDTCKAKDVPCEVNPAVESRSWDPTRPRPPAARSTPAASASKFGAPEYSLYMYKFFFDPSLALPLRDITDKEREQCKKSWPPPDEVFQALGLPPPSHPDADAWYAICGLRNPALWTVSAPALLAYNSDGADYPEYDDATGVMPNISEHESQVRGGIYGVNSCYLDETLLELSYLITTSNFWSPHGRSIIKKDQLIAVYGGPYVLGQKESDLKLVHGREHTALTLTLLRAKNVVYVLTMLCLPAEPFNTLVFTFFHRGPGFGYHADQVAHLGGKNVTMTEQQPVCTTVLYEKPVTDMGKETVYWIPAFGLGSGTKNSSKKYSDATYERPYCALCNLETRHGTEHVQSSGLQSISKHAVLHTSGKGSRTGARVAITSRVSHPDAAARVEAFKAAWKRGKVYKEEVGVQGTTTVAWGSTT